MQRYLLRRVFNAVFVVWAAYTVTFFLLYLLPSDPVSMQLNNADQNASGGNVALDASIVAALNERYGFDKPLIVQYLTIGGRFLTGDLGTSIATGVPVVSSLAEALPQTVLLAGLALLLSLVFGVGLAVIATYTRVPWLRQALLSLPPLGMSVPTFWVGLVLLQVFSFQLGLFPALGNEGFESLVLPAITLAIPTAAVYAQVLSKSLFDVLDQPYIETAKAKGASRLRVHLAHAFRNGAIPTLTLIGLTVGNIVAGAVVIETVFSRAGIGRITQIAVNAQDIPVVQAVVVLSAVAFALVNLAVDLVYPLVDPRIRRVAA